MDCSCQNFNNSEHISWEKFKEVRKNCSVLREIFIPEEILNEVGKQVSEFHDIANHNLHTYLALERGHLFRMTTPIHNLLMEGNTPHAKLTAQYKKDLQEKWIIENDVKRRHQKSRIFQGKLYELICAGLLNREGWEITNLEALGGKWDIEGHSGDGLENIVEVKFLGQLDILFEANLTNNPVRLSPYDAVNYLLFRASEAAKKLSQSRKDKPTKRIVIINLSNQIEPLLDIQLSENWITWESPHFLTGSENWVNFINNSQRKKFLSELGKLPNQIHEIRILAEKENYELTNIKTISFAMNSKLS